MRTLTSSQEAGPDRQQRRRRRRGESSVSENPKVIMSLSSASRAPTTAVKWMAIALGGYSSSALAWIHAPSRSWYSSPAPRTIGRLRSLSVLSSFPHSSHDRFPTSVTPTRLASSASPPDYEELDEDRHSDSREWYLPRDNNGRNSDDVKSSQVRNMSWMERNAAQSSSRRNISSSSVVGLRRRKDDGGNMDGKSRRRDDRNQRDQPAESNFRQDFRGTRVFVQGLPPTASWQDLKDHFRIAGDVVFASVSTDRTTGESKCCGIVQYETTAMAKNAMEIMRNHPMDNDYTLYVREDVQEAREGMQLINAPTPFIKRGQYGQTTPPTKWKCANEADSAEALSQEQLQAVRSLVKARDDARRRRQYDVSDNIREELKSLYQVYIDDRLKMWWTSMDDGKSVPQSIRDIKGEDGKWDSKLKPWSQIPTTAENDACVNAELVMALLDQRDIARREKDFPTADSLLKEARDSPDGELFLRIHDESRTWRVWTPEPPPRPISQDSGSRERRFRGDRNGNDDSLSPVEQCLSLTRQYAPEKVTEMETLLSKFPGREWAILKKLKQTYLNQET
jgi:RNA recognition motif-containing protein